METKKVEIIEHDVWHKEGVELFGEDYKKWQYIYPSCKTIQKFEDWKKHTDFDEEKILQYLGFSCIGRITRGLGCDWSMGGLFFHTDGIKVKHPSGKLIPFMRFNKK